MVPSTFVMVSRTPGRTGAIRPEVERCALALSNSHYAHCSMNSRRAAPRSDGGHAQYGVRRATPAHDDAEDHASQQL